MYVPCCARIFAGPSAVESVSSFTTWSTRPLSASAFSSTCQVIGPWFMPCAVTLSSSAARLAAGAIP